MHEQEEEIPKQS